MRLKALENLNSKQPLSVEEVKFKRPRTEPPSPKNARSKKSFPRDGQGDSSFQPSGVFGEDVFGAKDIREKLSRDEYDRFMNSLQSHESLDPKLADLIATAMKDWAINKGATHYTHWFQPLTGGTAEKHDSFITFTGNSYNKKLIMNFSGKELIKGEPDASSFPSGGMRSTFEARGYTAWDTSSPSFILRTVNGTFLVIPTAFFSWTGETLDLKIPLLKSAAVLSKATVRVLRLLGNESVKSAHSNLGVEQEFFTIDRSLSLARPDLQATGRTLIGARSPKGQNLEDHYFATMDRRVLAYIQEVEWTLWKLGIPVKTRHNEVAPSQFEIAPIYEEQSVACDHNMLMMQVLEEVAKKHGLETLLHEKPFSYVNGSGKHNNWSIETDKGDNLMDPGHSPIKNIQFMIMLSAIVRSISLHGDLLRISVSNPGNDFRLGANEAPPAIISVYIGDELNKVVEALLDEKDHSHQVERKVILGVASLPVIPRETSDRNRTSPFAFTSNKFEFRAVGSSETCAKPQIILNTIIADSLKYIGDRLEKEIASQKTKNPEEAASCVIREVLKEHRRAIFNGDGYSPEWVKEAEKRGLPNLKSFPEAVLQMTSPKNLKLFSENGVLTEKELKSQQATLYENFIKTFEIEAQILLNMVNTGVIPASVQYKIKLASAISGESSGKFQTKRLAKLNSLIEETLEGVENLQGCLEKLEHIEAEKLHEKATFLRHDVLDCMQKLRTSCDQLESLVEDELWPFPKYTELLHLK